MKYSDLFLIGLIAVLTIVSPLPLQAKEDLSINTSLKNSHKDSSVQEETSEQSTDSIEEEIAGKDSYSLEEELSQHPLDPPNSSSPRATIQGFVDSMNLAYIVLMEAHRENLQSPGIFTTEPILKQAQIAEELISRSVHYLDLSKVPIEFHHKVGNERALMLKEILDRIKTPTIEDIPGIEAIEKEQEEEKIAELDRWRIPHTNIVIARVEEGPNKGEFLFTAQTVDQLEAFYNKVSHLPYKLDEEISRDFYDFYATTPGWLLPPKWYKWLPAWSTNLLFGQVIWELCVLLFSPLVTLLLVWKLMRIWIIRSTELSTTAKIVGWGMIALANITVVVLVNYILTTYVKFSGFMLIFVESTLTKLLIIFLVVIALWETLKSSIKGQIPEEETKEDDFDDEWGANSLSRVDTLLIILKKTIIIAIFTIVGFLLLSAMGVNIGPLLAGAGVIGIAIGFGSQKLISDILSGVFFLIDDAFRVGEYIEAGSVSGTVEALTLRNVMLRHHRGMLQIVPYCDLGSITNYMRGGIVIKFNLEFPYDTDINKVRKIIKKVGIAMLEDEEFGKSFIRPVKSQGVREITGSVMVIRVKFTAQPGAHFVIRREAFRRITEALVAKGINYAHRKVIVELPQEDQPEITSEKEILKAGAAVELARQEEEKKAIAKKNNPYQAI